MRVLVSPVDALVDEPPSIKVERAPASDRVWLELTTSDAAAHLWRYVGTYRMGRDGVLDLARDAPVEGPYDGVDPIGPFWGMRFASDEVAPVAFAAPPDRLSYDLSARCGDEHQSVTLVRRWRAVGVESRPLAGHGFVGTLFLPAGGSRSAVLVLPGSTGKAAMEPTAALLASHGHAALVAAYMHEDGLPPGLKQIPIEVVGLALDALRSATGASAIAALAASVGTQGMLAALALGAAEVDCAVAIAPSSVIWQALPAGGGRPPSTAAWSSDGRPLQWLPIRGERIVPQMLKNAVLGRLSRSPRPSALRMLGAYAPSLKDEQRVARAAIPVERVSCPLLLICGEDDQLWPAAEMAQALSRRRHAAGTAEQDIVLSFPSAGHFIRPPITPTTVPWSEDLVSGGTPVGNARAQSRAWTALLDFLRTHLRTDGAVP